MLMMPKSVSLAQSFLLGIRWQVSLVLKTELVQNGILKGPLSQTPVLLPLGFSISAAGTTVHHTTLLKPQPEEASPFPHYSHPSC